MSGTLLVIDPDGTKTRIRHEKKDQPELKVIQRAVGGYIERIRVRFNHRLRDAYVNEDGLSMGLAYNPHVRMLSQHTIVGSMAIWIPDGKPPTPDGEPGNRKPEDMPEEDEVL
jgi:hypothetical protein